MYGPTQTTITRFRPGWVEDLTTLYWGRIARQFVLHFNLSDFVMDLTEKKSTEGGKGEYIRMGKVVGAGEQLPTLREYLRDFLFSEFGCQSIYSYSLANGLVAVDGPQSSKSSTAFEREMHSLGWQRMHSTWKLLKASQPKQQNNTDQQKEQDIDLPKDNEIADNFKLLGHMLRRQYYAREKPATNEPEKPIGVILDYVEKLIPYRLGDGHGDREQLQALEVIQRWALDPDIRKTNNIIILLTTNIGQIPASVYAEGSGCRPIRVPLPDMEERAAFIDYKMNKARARLVKLDSIFGETQDRQIRGLARLTQGMRLTDIDNVSRRVIIEAMKLNRDKPNPVMTSDDVQRAKSEVIQAQSEQLLEIIPPVRGFNEIGGLKNLKEYLRSRTDLMLRESNSPLVPSGLLLAGPPGTGKTIIAEALATEGRFNLVKMRSIQDKWIGSSERNLELVLNLLKDLHPVVVFVDEIDQAMVRRDTGQGGDSGVGARMFARILEEMSNASNRGRILWVAATNRADIIDEALLRRFDRVIPLLTPDFEETCRIFAAMPATIIKQSGGVINVDYGGDLKQSQNKDEEGRGDPTQEDLEKFRVVAETTVTLGLTGAGIEVVVRRAIELAFEEVMKSGQPAFEPKVPQVESRHLTAAVDDYKPNHNRLTYDYQSLLAIRACNFRSVIPPLPRDGPFGRIQGEGGRIDVDKLEAEILEIERSLGSRRAI